MMLNEDVRISPSILSADFLALGSSLAAVRNADLIHFDAMDGHYVPNVSFGPDVLRAVKRGTDLPVDVHLMVTNPDDVCKSYLDAGADLLTFHVETARHARRIVDEIHQAGRLAGVSLNPGTPVSALEALVDAVDLVLVMSVNPGFGGQSFIGRTYRQLDALVALCERCGVRPLIEVDGGVSPANAERVVAHGARALVGGSAIFGADVPARAVEEMRAAGRRGLLKKA